MKPEQRKHKKVTKIKVIFEDGTKKTFEPEKGYFVVYPNTTQISDKENLYFHEFCVHWTEER